MKRYVFVVVILALTAVAVAGVVGKDGSTLPDNPPVINSKSEVGRAAFEWNSGGAVDTVPNLGGSSTGWGPYFIVMTTNTVGSDVFLSELGFPCGGPAGTWMVWVGSAQPADSSAPDYSGPFTPTDPSPDTFPPTTYTYVDVTASNVLIPAGSDFWFGYENPGIGGQVDFNGVVTYAWYGGAWDSDEPYGRTAVMQVFVEIVPVELQSFSIE